MPITLGAGSRSTVPSRQGTKCSSAMVGTKDGEPDQRGGRSSRTGQALAAMRPGISLVGCDTLAVDAAGSMENPAHYALLGNEVYTAENLKNLDRLASFCLFAAFPLRIRGGSGSPVRAVALVPR